MINITNDLFCLFSKGVTWSSLLKVRQRNDTRKLPGNKAAVLTCLPLLGKIWLSVELNVQILIFSHQGTCKWGYDILVKINVSGWTAIVRMTWLAVDVVPGGILVSCHLWSQTVKSFISSVSYERSPQSMFNVGKFCFLYEQIKNDTRAGAWQGFGELIETIKLSLLDKNLEKPTGTHTSLVQILKISGLSLRPQCGIIFFLLTLPSRAKCFWHYPPFSGTPLVWWLGVLNCTLQNLPRKLQSIPAKSGPDGAN